MRADPKTRALEAMGHRQFRGLAAVIPKADLNDPKLLLSWLLAAAEVDPRGSDTPLFSQMHVALREWVEVDGLRDRAARLYHDRTIQHPPATGSTGISRTPRRRWNG